MVEVSNKQPLLPGGSQGQEPGGLPSMGSHRVGHDWSDLASNIIKHIMVRYTFSEEHVFLLSFEI